MRSETWLCATALALAFATPAFAQTPAASSPRLLPSAAAAYGNRVERIGCDSEGRHIVS